MNVNVLQRNQIFFSVTNVSSFKVDLFLTWVTTMDKAMREIGTIKFCSNRSEAISSVSLKRKRLVLPAFLNCFLSPFSQGLRTCSAVVKTDKSPKKSCNKERTNQCGPDGENQKVCRKPIMFPHIGNKKRAKRCG